MKSVLIVLFALATSHAFAASVSETAAVSAFSSDSAIQQQITDIGAVTTGNPIAVRIYAFGDGCDLMETYIVSQPVRSESNPGPVAVSGRVEVSTYDRQECEGSGGIETIVESVKPVDLNSVTQ